MSRMRTWLLLAVAVALVAFLSGLLRGVSGTSPFEVEDSSAARPVSTNKT